MSILGGVFFVACAALALSAAVATVTLRSPLRAAVALLVHVIALAGLYASLRAELLAAVQLIVYAGAVVVLFVFVIMTIGPTANPQPTTRGVLVRTLGAGLMALVGGAIALQLARVSRELPTVLACTPERGSACAELGSVEALGRVLFVDAFVPFEIVSVLLIVAVIGAITVASGRAQRGQVRQ